MRRRTTLPVCRVTIPEDRYPDFVILFPFFVRHPRQVRVLIGFPRHNPSALFHFPLCAGEIKRTLRGTANDTARMAPEELHITDQALTASGATRARVAAQAGAECRGCRRHRP